MAGRDRPSSIDKLPSDVRELIYRLRVEKGCTIDQIRAQLSTLLDADNLPSRSSLGRHIERDLKNVADKMRRTKEITESLARIGNRADNKMMRGTIELLNSILLEVSLAEEEGEDGEPRPIQFNPAQIKALAQTAESLARAEKLDAEREQVIRDEARKKALAEQKKKLEDAGKAGDLDPAALIRAKRILGFDI